MKKKKKCIHIEGYVRFKGVIYPCFNHRRHKEGLLDHE